MVQNEENYDVYNNLTEKNKSSSNNKWTVYLALCCLTACMGSFNFGFNIGALNLPTPIIKNFFASRYASDYFESLEKYETKMSTYKTEIHMITESKLIISSPSNFSDELVNKSRVLINKLEEIQNGMNISEMEKLDAVKEKLSSTKIKLDEAFTKINDQNTLLWAITNSLFVFGGMFGAFSSKYVLEYLGRKKGILFHYIFSTCGAIFALIAPQFSSPYFAIGLIMLSRFFFGLQGGMMCGIVPTYLNEIAPAALRGSCGVINQLCITIGIFFAQILGARQLLGTKDLWEYILAFPFITSVGGGLVLLFFFSETPKALLLTNKDEEATRATLKRLRNKVDVEDEIEEMIKESKENGSDSASTISFKELFTLREFRWPLITSLTLQLTQQLCGINAIFFYSDGIFRRAGIPDESIQYAIFATGFINVLCTIIVVPLIEKLGRKPLLVYPMCLMIATFITLTFCLVFQDKNIIFSYLSIICIIVFICCFAVGLGPIPFIYATEVFSQESRGAALATCMTLNWIANFFLSLTFEYLAKIFTDYVFLIFTVVVTISVVVIFQKVPETKNKSLEEILAAFEGRKLEVDEDGTGKPMLATSKV